MFEIDLAPGGIDDALTDLDIDLAGGLIETRLRAARSNLERFEGLGLDQFESGVRDGVHVRCHALADAVLGATRMLAMFEYGEYPPLL